MVAMIDFTTHFSNLTPEMQWWLNQILELILARSGMSPSEAVDAMLQSSSFIEVRQNPMWLLRESPLYWAMEILEGREVLIGLRGPDAPFWWQDPQKNGEFEKYEAWLHTLSPEQRSVRFS